MAAASGGEAWPPPPSPTPSPTASSAAGTRRRARFDAADDLCIVQAVRRYEPYAAGHGSKVRVWEQVARDTQQHAGSRNLRISSRAVSDRFLRDDSFRLLMRMHKNGSLQERHRNDVNAEVVDATSEALRAVADRMDEIRDQAGHVRKRRRGLGRRPLLDGLTVPESVEVDFAVSATPNAEPTTLRLRSDEDTDSSPLHVLASADDMTLVLPSPPPQPPTATTTPERSEALTSKTQQLLELRREKLELKKRKLELLERQHAERMALLQRRLDLEEQRAQQEAAARREEWAALLAALRALQPPGAELGAASSSAMDVGASLSDF